VECKTFVFFSFAKVKNLNITTGSIVRNVPAPTPDVKDSLPRG